MITYRLVEGRFEETPDPTDGPDTVSPEAAIADAGYLLEVSSAIANGAGAAVNLYRRDAAPCFYVEILGAHASLGAFVADDFPQLVLALKEIHPLISLAGLDQVVWARAIDEPTR